MRVGVPKEIKNHEYRVGLTPGSVREFSDHGHEVLVETAAGDGIGCGDEAYEAAGATIVGAAAEVFERADMEHWRNHPVFRPPHAETGPVEALYSSGNLLVSRAVLEAMDAIDPGSL